jgi:hypothetical protein
MFGQGSKVEGAEDMVLDRGDLTHHKKRTNIQYRSTDEEATKKQELDQLVSTVLERSTNHQGNGSHEIPRLRPTAPGTWPWHLRACLCDFQEYMPVCSNSCSSGYFPMCSLSILAIPSFCDNRCHSSYTHIAPFFVSPSGAAY